MSVQLMASERFLAALDQLRRERGVSLRRLSRRTGIPASTLHHWMTRGKRLPSWDEVRKIVRACDAEEGAWLSRWRAAGRLPVRRVRSVEVVPAHRPAQLPPDVADFTGRADLLSVICGAVSSAATTGVPVVALAGPPGVGKTALVVHAAHRLRPAFPDGQLVAAMGGAHRHPKAPAEVLAQFLRALGVDDASLPRGVDDRAARLRSLLADRRMLLLLDDAADAAQLRPLLPGTAGCAVLVTSRPVLADLEGARHVEVGVLDERDGWALFDRIVGGHRVAGEPAAARDIVRLCGGLPLALRIVGAKLATRSGRRLSSLAGRLADERLRLGELRVADLEVRSGFLLGYHGLTPSLRHVFAALGLLPPAAFAPWTLAALLDVDADEAERALDALADAHLVVPVGVDAAGQARFRLHDLLWLFARERAREDVPEPERLNATTRLVERCHELVRALGAALAPGRPDAGDADLGPQPLVVNLNPDRVYEAERGWLAAAVRMVSDGQDWDRTWRLAAGLAEIFVRADHRDEWAATNAVGLLAAHRTADDRAIGIMLRSAGKLSHQRGDHADALGHLTEALRRFENVPDPYQASLATFQLGEVHLAAGRTAAARAAFETAFPVLLAAEDLHVSAWALRGLAMVARADGRPDDAAAALREAVALCERGGDGFSLAYLVSGLGELYREAGDLDRASAQLERALGLFDSADRIGDRPGRGHALLCLGEVAVARGDLGQARVCLAESRRIFAELELPRWESRARSALVELADQGKQVLLKNPHVL